MDVVTHRNLSPGIRFHSKAGIKVLLNSSTKTNPSIYQLTSANQADQSMLCPICGHQGVVQQTVLWPELIQAWQLTVEETALINRQQGEQCIHCQANLRSRTLAGAFGECLNWSGSLEKLLSNQDQHFPTVLEINEAGNCHEFLKKWPSYTFASYPDIDMQAMPYADGTYDFVIHSDTLEHVPDPIIALKECKRVLTSNGILIMTIPIVPTRLTKRCDRETPSYHGQSGSELGDMQVISEYGADFYMDLFAAGWNKLSMYTLGSVASIAVIGIK